MKAIDFNLEKELKFSLETGITSFKDSRLLLFDANSIGLLRQTLIEEIGFEKARTFFLRFGYQNGYADALQMKLNYDFDSEMDFLASGPVIHTWEGIVHAQPMELEFNREKGEMFFTGVWTNSYEAEQHLCYNDFSKESVCWSLAGYASGWTSVFMGRFMLAMEPVCMGKGDDHCEWKIQPPEAWGEEAKPYLEALEIFREVK